MTTKCITHQPVASYGRVPSSTPAYRLVQYLGTYGIAASLTFEPDTIDVYVNPEDERRARTLTRRFRTFGGR